MFHTMALHALSEIWTVTHCLTPNCILMKVRVLEVFVHFGRGQQNLAMSGTGVLGQYLRLRLVSITRAGADLITHHCLALHQPQCHTITHSLIIALYTRIITTD